MVYANLNLKRMASALIRKHHWLPVGATLASGLGLAIALVIRAGLLLELGGVAALLFTSYVWGYSTRAFKQILWPPLTHLQRRQYAEVWDSLAPSLMEAEAAAAGHRNEDAFRLSALACVHNLLELGSVGPQDEVLEIGCGVGRIGLALAPHCRLWTGADISGNMLTHALDRLRGISNVRLVHLHDVGLGEFPDNSFDVVYAINMFAHLDGIDRWRYVEEASRVLRFGGRIYIDNIDLESDAGWMMFANHAKRYQSLERPPYDTRFSTAMELMTYVTRANFRQVLSHRRPPLVIVTGIKPSLGKG